MKIIYTLIIGLFIFTSCNSPEETSDESSSEQKDSINTTAQTQVGDEGSDMENQLSDQWILVKRKSLKKDTTVNFNPEPPTVVTQFKISGFFSISDLIEVSSEDGLRQQLENRVSGQWEIKDKKLVMRFGTGDTTSVTTYKINQLTKDRLVLENSEKQFINTYSKRK